MGNFRVSLFPCHASTRHTYIFHAPGYSEKNRTPIPGLPVQLSVDPWQAQSPFQIPKNGLSLVNVQASPQQSQWVMDDGGRNSPPNAVNSLRSPMPRAVGMEGPKDTGLLRFMGKGVVLSLSLSFSQENPFISELSLFLAPEHPCDVETKASLVSAPVCLLASVGLLIVLEASRLDMTT